jgi:hypothetical protein
MQPSTTIMIRKRRPSISWSDTKSTDSIFANPATCYKFWSIQSRGSPKVSIKFRRKIRNLLIDRAVRFGAGLCMMIALQGCLGGIEGTGRSQSVMVGTNDICTANGFRAAEVGIGNKFGTRNENAPRIDVYKNNVAWSGEQARLGQMSVSRCLTPPVNQSYVDEKRSDQAYWQDKYDGARAAQRAANGVAFDGFMNGLSQGLAAWSAAYAASGGLYGGSGYPGTTGGNYGSAPNCWLPEVVNGPRSGPRC